ncbi:MAG: nicotinate-nucleotide adenylyltransferase [Candidatus Eremiobacteraeota bacterium]|nr:nicotinate-nucleotide adenylyltransferase [Candidatus Eremiobacteraeota bacterium]
MLRLGVFGGTFDPVHNAHLFVAESAGSIERLDRVLFVPTNGTHYRDAAHVDAAHRCAMILGAISGNARFALDDSDLREDASGYTADLLPRLQAKYPGASLTFITGSDSLASNTWVRFEEALESLEAFVIAPRAGVRPEAVSRVMDAVPARLRERVKMLHVPEIPESATMIRMLLAQGRSIRYLVPDPVYDYIVRHRLYSRDA